MKDDRLKRGKCGLLVVDVQEKLISHLERSAEILTVIQKAIKGFQLLSLPIFVTEQYPEGLGATVAGIKSLLGPKQHYFVKTTFSCCANEDIRLQMQNSGITQWVVVGIEAHVCVLQTAKDLLVAGFDVVVLNDAIASRSIYDFSTAIAEMRDYGIRISCSETILFELVHDSMAPEFKKLSQLIK